MDKLDAKLRSIEDKLGGDESMPVGVQDKLGWHLDYIESLISGSSSGGTKLYKHSVTAEVNGADAVFEIIATTDTSLTNQKIDNVYDIGLISAFFMSEDLYYSYMPVLYFTYESESAIIIPDNYGGLERLDCFYFGIDTVTEL